MAAYFILAIYVALPFLLLKTDRKWGAVAAILGLWLPIEFRVLSAAGVPGWAATVSGMLAGVFAFRWRPEMIDVSAAFDLRKFSLRQASLNFALFAVVGLPLALAIGFVRPSLDLTNLHAIPRLLATIFLLNALPEEILFRGMIQHTIESVNGSRVFAAALASLIFGAAHLNNGPDVPNYKYFAMATLAGLFYSRAWRTHRNVLTSSLTHTMVNTVWRLLLR